MERERHERELKAELLRLKMEERCDRDSTRGHGGEIEMGS